MSARPKSSAIRKVHLREPEPTGTIPPIPELALVELMVGSRTIEGVDVPAGRVGTVVFVYAEGEAYEVEFAEPVGTLVTVPAEHVREVEPVA